MAIEYSDMSLILTVMKNRSAGAGEKLLILGDAQILISVEEFLKLAKKIGYKLTSIPSEMTPFTFGQAIGFSETETLDINGRTSITLDLQENIPSHLLENFDCLIDAGVLFWCFEPGKALKNIFRLVAPQGLIFHITAIAGFYGRAYYNVHPMLFNDFYGTNKCIALMSSFRGRPSRVYTVLHKIKNLLFQGRKVDMVSSFYGPGNIYLDQSNRGWISFGKKLKTPESSILPNNAIGVFAFKKNSANIHPHHPYLV